MIFLSSVMNQFEADLLNTYQGRILSSQRKALAALKICRTKYSPVMQVNCTDCDHQTFPKKILEKMTLHLRPQLTCECCGGKMEVSRTRIPIGHTPGSKPKNQAWIPT